MHKYLQFNGNVKSDFNINVTILNTHEHVLYTSLRNMVSTAKFYHSARRCFLWISNKRLFVTTAYCLRFSISKIIIEQHPLYEPTYVPYIRISKNTYGCKEIVYQKSNNLWLFINLNKGYFNAGVNAVTRQQ